jgi:FkbM family methyltransferase
MRSPKALIARLLSLAGWEVRRTDPGRGDSMEDALCRLAPRHPVATVIDVGASDGRWSRQALRHFPEAAYLLIEAQSGPHEGALKVLAAARKKVQYVIAAAGDHEGSTHFDASDPLGGVASAQPTGKADLVVPMVTVDAEVRRRGLSPPYLLKLDTHGFEPPIFEGAHEVLAATALLVVEAYNFELVPGTLRFHQLCTYLETRGLRCIDVADVMRRPGDRAFWQCDLFFVPKESPEFSSNSFR